MPVLVKFVILSWFLEPQYAKAMRRLALLTCLILFFKHNTNRLISRRRDNLQAGSPFRRRREKLGGCGKLTECRKFSLSSHNRETLFYFISLSTHGTSDRQMRPPRHQRFDLQRHWLLWFSTDYYDIASNNPDQRTFQSQLSSESI
jgi:hypothetical protein